MSKIVDLHCHVGLVGDEHPEWGKMSEWYRKQIVYKIFLLFAGLKEDQVSDSALRVATEKAISGAYLDHVVCLALDPVYDNQGQRREDLSHMWVDNDYIIDLKGTVGPKVLLGASVHPYDPLFQERVEKYVEKGAVLLKWLPSAQQINLADVRVRAALYFLATARNGKPLPLLLHVGMEYAVPSSDPRTKTYDFLSWTFWDKIGNMLRKKKWHRPDVKLANEHLDAGLQAGAVIIFAHCGLPYYAPNFFASVLEHSEFKTVRKYIEENPPGVPGKGYCFADISACVTPFRRSYFNDIKKIPTGRLLFGSDFPTPVFELSTDKEEMEKDFKAILKGDFKRIIIPQDNLINVNRRELEHFFPGHPMFTNFSEFLSSS